MTPADASTVAAGIAAAVGLLVACWTGLRRLIRRLDRVDEVLRRELDHNHGSSIKDDVHGVAVASHESNRKLDNLSDQVDVLRRRLDAHQADHDAELRRRRWWRY